MPLSRLIFLRHGQTANNFELRIQGSLNTDLNDVGRQQAADVAVQLSNLGITRIIASDLSRAFETARIVGGVIRLEVETDERLRERGYGVWEGLTSEEIKANNPDAWVRWRNGEEPGAPGVQTRDENGELVAAAVADAVAEAEKSDKPETILVVSHGSAIVDGLMVMMGQKPSSWNILQGMDNCHWAMVTPRPRANPKWRIQSYNRWFALTTPTRHN